MKKILISGLVFLAVGCSPAASETPQPAANTPTTADTAAPEDVAAEATNTEIPSDGEVEASTQEAATPDAAVQDITEAEPEANYLNTLRGLLLEVRTRNEAFSYLNEIQASGDTRYVAGLIDVLRWQRGLAPEISATLSELTGADDVPPEWHDWVEWAGQHPEIESFAEYDLWKSSLFSLTDPNFNRFVYPDVAVADGSRLEEIVWGGVRVDGIPALDNPTMIDPGDADYLLPDERVFGVSINGDTRAYPARFLDWHEMFNDVVGGEPVSLAY